MRKLVYLSIALVLPLCFACKTNSSETKTTEEKVEKKQLGIATYSVKGLSSDVEGSLQALADDGYTVMEMSNYNAAERTVEGMQPAEYAALAEKYGLDIISSHARGKFDAKDVEGTLGEWGKIFDDHQAMGVKYVIFPMNIWSGPDALDAECDLLNKIGEEANKRNIKFGYHNHSFEFVKVPDTDILYEDYLITHTDADKVIFQMDVYWITVGGQDPVAYLQKYPDRIKLLHIKDDYVIGASGKIDYEAIFNQFYANGNSDWFVEMESKPAPEDMGKPSPFMKIMADFQAQGGPSSGKTMADLMPQRGGGGTPPPPPAPEEIAEQLSVSLEGIKESADYLKNAAFVK